MTPLLYRPRIGPVKFSPAECTLLECPECPPAPDLKRIVTDSGIMALTPQVEVPASVQCLDGCGPFITW